MVQMPNYIPTNYLVGCWSHADKANGESVNN